MSGRGKQTKENQLTDVGMERLIDGKIAAAVGELEERMDSKTKESLKQLQNELKEELRGTFQKMVKDALEKSPQPVDQRTVPLPAQKGDPAQTSWCPG